MAGTNQFLPFGLAGGAYVYNYATWLAEPKRLTGYPPGLLKKEELNTALRQAAFVSSALSQWTVDETGSNQVDNGVSADWITVFEAALALFITGITNLTFTVYAGNPNGNVAGTQGNPASAPKVFPTTCWDTTNTIWWVCTVTGNAAGAIWVPVGDDAQWPYWCTVTGGTANAPTLTTPAVMDRLVAGTSVAWTVTLDNTNAVVVTVGAFGAKQLYKSGPTGPEPLTGGELQAGNIVSARYDGVRLQLTATELGTAALANASSGTGTVAAVQNSGFLGVGNLPEYVDAFGTLGDSGASAASLRGAADSVLYTLGEIN